MLLDNDSRPITNKKTALFIRMFKSVSEYGIYWVGFNTYEKENYAKTKYVVWML
jgi:hypothetical protein